MQNFRGAVVFIGNENTFTFTQAYGTTQNKAIFDMKPNQVLQVPPGEFAKMGAKAIFVRLTKIEPGKKADLKDKKTKERIQLQVAAQRAKPWQEHLSKLWSSSKIDTENPQDKKYIETIFFPDRQQK